MTAFSPFVLRTTHPSSQPEDIPVQFVHLGQLTLSGAGPGLSAWVDTRGFNGCSLILVTGAVTDAGTVDGFTATLEEGDDTTTAGATAVATSECVNEVATIQVTADGDDNVIAGAVGYLGDARYARLSILGTAGTAAVVDVYAAMSHPAQGPATLIGTSVAAT